MIEYNNNNLLKEIFKSKLIFYGDLLYNELRFILV
jgi:hypothetical protein